MILGGRQLHDGEDYIVGYLTDVQVREIAEALRSVDRDRLHVAYLAIDIDDYGSEHGAEDFAYTWADFVGPPEFFEHAAGTGRHVIFTAGR